MQKTMIFSILAIGIIVAIASTIFFQNDVSGDPPLIKIATSNENFTKNEKFAYFGQPVINNNDEIVFPAFMDDKVTSWAIFKSSKGSITKILSSGDSTPVGGAFSALGSVSVNDDKIIFHGRVIGGSTDQGIFEMSSNKVKKLVSKGEETPIGGTFEDLAFPSKGVNTKGDMIFFGFIKNGPSQNGLFYISNGKISKVVSQGEVFSDGRIFNNVRYGIQPINDSGDVVFTSYLIGAPSYQGIFIWSNGQITPLITTSDLTSTGEKFTVFDPPSINNKKEIVFFGGNTDNPNSKGIYKFAEKKLSKILSVGDVSPIDGVFYHMDSISINEKGDITFVGFIKDGNKEYGVFRISGNQISKVAIGDLSPTGQAFNMFNLPVLNNNGNVAFSGTTIKDKKTSQGIFVMEVPVKKR